VVFGGRWFRRKGRSFAFEFPLKLFSEKLFFAINPVHLWMTGAAISIIGSIKGTADITSSMYQPHDAIARERRHPSYTPAQLQAILSLHVGPRLDT